jgi:hypothetical protein
MSALTLKDKEQIISEKLLTRAGRLQLAESMLHSRCAACGMLILNLPLHYASIDDLAHIALHVMET